MKLFGIDFGSREPGRPRITPADRERVEKCFRLMLKVYGFPRVDQYLPDEKSFPQTFAAPEFRVDNLLADCCQQLGLDKQRFAYQVFQDLRDTRNTPYAFAGAPADCALQVDEASGNFIICLSNDVFKRPQWLMPAICVEMVKALLMQHKMVKDDGRNTNPFWYTAAVYFGFGVVIGRNLTNIGRSSAGQWEQRWAYVQNIPLPVLAYALAVFAKLQNELQPPWQSALPAEVSTEFARAVAYLKDVDDELFDAKRSENENTAAYLFNRALAQYQANEFTTAVASLQSALSLTTDARLKAGILHNIGYYNIRLANYAASIDALRSCLDNNPSQQFAHDNLGLALLMTGELEAGKQQLDLARQSARNNEAYSDRNLALYHQKKQEYALAETNFQKAFAHQIPVDELDFFYGQFLLETGQPARGLDYLRAAARRGEPAAVAWLQARDGRADPP